MGTPTTFNVPAAFICVTVLLASCDGSAPSLVDGTSPTANPNITLDERKVQVEEQKLRLEAYRLRSQVTSSWAQALGVGVPILAGILALVGALFLKDREVRAAEKLKRQESRAAFLLKVLDAVSTSRSPGVAIKRFGVFKQMYKFAFAEDLPDIDLSELPGHMHDQRIELLRAMTAHLGQQKDVAEIWEKLFPDDVKWIPNLNKFANAVPPPSPAPPPVKP